jgi:chromatin modification-related protein VID21
MEEVNSPERPLATKVPFDELEPTDLREHQARVQPKPPEDTAIMQPPPDVIQTSVPRQRTSTVNGSPDTSATPRPSQHKPIMRIDTQAIAPFSNRTKEPVGVMESPMALTSACTPGRAPSSALFSAGQSPPGRITRISSGTIRHRSVSEILGETPKTSSLTFDKVLGQSSSSLPPRDSLRGQNGQSRSVDRREREKDRSTLSTVVFAKQQQGSNHAGSPLPLGGKTSSDLAPISPPERDYLHTLFESKAYSPPRGHPLTVLLQSAHKTLSTADQMIEYQEQMNCRTLKRIYQLQNANRWPLRQMKRVPEPVRQTSHWDFLLDHAKWMRTDFREERKWKLAAAKGVAEWCAEWVSGTPRRRQKLQVKIRPPPLALTRSDGWTSEAHGNLSAAPSPSRQTPDLVASTETESLSDGCLDEMMDLRLSTAPAAIFSLGPSVFSFPVSKTPAADKLLNELPFYRPTPIEVDLSHSDLAERSDSTWKTDLVAISRLASEKVRYHPPKPPRKRSRYDYEEEDFLDRDSKTLPPEQTSVALFMPENKHIRDRIHPGHSFRPPSEYPMPTQAFFESRTSSQWTQNEDDELRRYVKDYSYNWSLISSCLSTSSPYHSGADRRTPWECFERWINLEGLPADMSKTPYFRAYHTRIEAAGRHVLAQQEAAQRQPNGNTTLNTRKRTTQPVRIERKRSQRHLALLDAMRKLAKKRETTLQKQQHGKNSDAKHGIHANFCHVFDRVVQFYMLIYK